MATPPHPSRPGSIALAATRRGPHPWRAGVSRVLAARSVRLLVLVGLLGWGLLHALEWMGGPAEIRSDYGLAAAALLVPAQAVVAVSPVPGEVIALAYVSIYGYALGCGFAWAGWMLGAGLEYALYRRAAAELGELEGLERLPVWLRRLPVEHPVFLIAGRWVPLCGTHLVNAMAGAYRVPLWRFTWTSALGLVPASILIATIAEGIVAR